MPLHSSSVTNMTLWNESMQCSGDSKQLATRMTYSKANSHARQHFTTNHHASTPNYHYPDLATMTSKPTTLRPRMHDLDPDECKCCEFCDMCLLKCDCEM